MPSADAWWPWLAVAGLGALHGLSPANGWLFAAAHAHRHGDPRHVLRMLWPIAAGHIASVLLVVTAVMLGTLREPPRMATLAGAVLLGMAACRALRKRSERGADTPPPPPVVGLALWSCLMGTVQGSGLMLVPALVPLCLSAGPARAITATGSFVLMLAAVALHLLAMLATTHAVATTVCCSLRLPWLARRANRLAPACTPALVLAGSALIVLP